MPGWRHRRILSRLGWSGYLALATPFLLAGVLPLRSEVSERWGWSGSWLFPVGDPYRIADAAPDSGSYRLVRGVIPATAHDGGHDGADLSNGRGGDPVRAAGNGLVVKVGGKGWNHGYGRHVVLAHRLPGGGLAYTVYAHLAPQSVTVAHGDLVRAGRVMGRVGMSGRATSPHLHFEVRVPDDPAARWENAPAVDPLGFVAARLASPRTDTLWSRPYLEWAECAALIPPGAPGSERLTRQEWWRALMAATRNPFVTAPGDADSLRRALIAADVLSEYTRGDPETELEWSELARDLRRARRSGLRLPWSPVAREERRKDCRQALGAETAMDASARAAKAKRRGPDRADMCLALADLAGDPPRRAKATPAAPARPKAKPDSTVAPLARSTPRADSTSARARATGGAADTTKSRTARAMPTDSTKTSATKTSATKTSAMKAPATKTSATKTSATKTSATKTSAAKSRAVSATPADTTKSSATKPRAAGSTPAADSMKSSTALAKPAKTPDRPARPPITP